MEAEQYWAKKHASYSQTDWIDKPSIFAEWAVQYFPPTGALLDLGAGQGQDSRFFANHGYQVIGTDFYAPALEIARQKSSKNIQYTTVDLSILPLEFDSESFNIVYAHLSLHYFDRKTTENLFSEIKRLLKPGGILAALFNSTDDPEASDGKVIENNFMLSEGIRKRYFSPEIARNFAKDFKIIIADNQGTTYKDESKGIHNLIRIVASKP